MASAAIAGVGATFSRATGDSDASYVALAEVNNITGPSMTRAFIDVTSLDSTGGYREFITGFRDAGEVKITMNFTIANYNLMLDDFSDADAHHYKIVLNDTGDTSIAFHALVTDMPLTVPTDDKVTIDVTFKLTGPIVLDT